MGSWERDRGEMPLILVGFMEEREERSEEFMGVRERGERCDGFTRRERKRDGLDPC